MAGIRGRHDSDVLLRQLDGHLAALRAGLAGRVRVGTADVAVAERVADALRQLVADTSRASAADRAPVRAAVHYFVSRPGQDRRPTRTLRDDVRIVNDILGELGPGDALA